MWADLHVHTNFSVDSRAEMEDYCIRAIETGMEVICFTECRICKRSGERIGFAGSVCETRSVSYIERRGVLEPMR